MSSLLPIEVVKSSICFWIFPKATKILSVETIAPPVASDNPLKTVANTRAVVKYKFEPSEILLVIDVSTFGTLPNPTSVFVVPCGFVPSSKLNPEWFVIIVGKLSKSL